MANGSIWEKHFEYKLPDLAKYFKVFLVFGKIYAAM